MNKVGRSKVECEVAASCEPDMVTDTRRSLGDDHKLPSCCQLVGTLHLPC